MTRVRAHSVSRSTRETALRAFQLAATASALIQLVSIISAFLAGAKFGRFASAAFESPIPLLSIPAVLVVIVGLVPPVASAVFAARVDRRSDAVLAGLGILVTFVFFALVPWGLARWYPAEGGVAWGGEPSGYGLGWHWLAVPLQSITVLALIIGLMRALGKPSEKGRRAMRIDFEVQEDPAVFLDVPVAFPHAQWKSVREWAKDAATHAAGHAPSIRRSSRAWRAEAALAAKTAVVGGEVGRFWAFGRETDPPAVVQLTVGERTDGRPIEQLAAAELDAAGSAPDTEDLIRGEIDSATHGRVAYAAGRKAVPMGSRTQYSPTYCVVSEPAEGALVVARYAFWDGAVDATLLEQMIALVESTRVETIPIEEAP